MDDPFRHHPNLRDKIAPADASFFRNLDLAELDARLVAAGQPADWRTPDDIREAGRKAVIDDHRGRDLWVFAYGSLMWDPAMIFAEVRRAHTPDHARAFCLWDDGARGSPDQPGLMLGIDANGAGSGCHGLAFRIAQDRIEHETFVLFRREMIAEGYVPTWVEVTTDFGALTALTFVADHTKDNIVPDIPIEDQAHMIAVAEGDLGSNFAYLDNLRSHLVELDVRDAYVEDLYRRVVALRGNNG